MYKRKREPIQRIQNQSPLLTLPHRNHQNHLIVAYAISLSFGIYLSSALNSLTKASQLCINLIKITLHENENPNKIHRSIKRKYFMSLKTEKSMSIIKANPDSARK